MMSTAELAANANAFRALHRGPPLLLMANAWDATGRFDAIDPAIGQPEMQRPMTKK
jgi:hypothetical protein